MLTRLIVFISLLLPLTGLSVDAQETLMTACDKHAASDLDFQRISEPILFTNINPGIAVPACITATTQFPSSSRLAYQLGRSLLADKKWLQGVQNVRKAAEAGYAAAQLALGIFYELGGFGMVKDTKEAALWYGKSAEQGNPKAQFRLGKMYAEAHENTQAFAWYCKAAEQGEADAEYDLGEAYLSGSAWYGAPMDYARAVEWLRKAAEQGHGLAQKHLELLMRQNRTPAKVAARGADKCREVLDCLKSGRICR